MKFVELLFFYRKIYKKYLKINKNFKLKYEIMYLFNFIFDVIKYQKGFIGFWDFRYFWGFFEIEVSVGFRGGGVFMEGLMFLGLECFFQNWGF